MTHFAGIKFVLNKLKYMGYLYGGNKDALLDSIVFINHGDPDEGIFNSRKEWLRHALVNHF